MIETGGERVGAHCIDCGRHFWREVDAYWKTRCVACYLKTKAAALPSAELETLRRDAEAGRQLREWFCQNIRDLIVLVHPDHHGGSERANRLTADLLKWRERYEKRP